MAIICKIASCLGDIDFVKQFYSSVVVVNEGFQARGGISWRNRNMAESATWHAGGIQTIPRFPYPENLSENSNLVLCYAATRCSLPFTNSSSEQGCPAHFYHFLVPSLLRRDHLIRLEKTGFQNCLAGMNNVAT